MILLPERVTKKANLQEIVPNVLVQASIIHNSCGQKCVTCPHHVLISTGAIKKKTCVVLLYVVIYHCLDGYSKWIYQNTELSISLCRTLWRLEKLLLHINHG